jgi:hypothetical protein
MSLGTQETSSPSASGRYIGKRTARQKAREAELEEQMYELEKFASAIKELEQRDIERQHELQRQREHEIAQHELLQRTVAYQRERELVRQQITDALENCGRCGTPYKYEYPCEPCPYKCLCCSRWQECNCVYRNY